MTNNEKKSVNMSVWKPTQYYYWKWREIVYPMKYVYSIIIEGNEIQWMIMKLWRKKIWKERERKKGQCGLNIIIMWTYYVTMTVVDNDNEMTMVVAHYNPKPYSMTNSEVMKRHEKY